MGPSPLPEDSSRVLVRAGGKASKRDSELKELVPNAEKMHIERTAPQVTALRESQDTLRLTLDAAHLGHWELDLVTHAMRRSLQYDRIFGYEELQPDWTYERFLSHVHPEDRERVDALFQAGVAAKTDWDFECRIHRRDGSLRWVWVHGNVFTDEAGEAAGMLGMVSDVTARRSNEERAVWLATFPERNPNPIVELDPVNGVFHYINFAAAAQFPDLEREALRHPLVAGLSEIAKEIVARGALRREIAVGARCYAQTVTYVAEARRVRIYSTDISERRQAEQIVREERDFSEAVLNSLPGVLYLYDTKGKFLRWNKNFERVTGYTAEEIAALHPLDFFRGEEKALVAERIGEVFVKGESDVEADFFSKDGVGTPYYFTGVVVELNGQSCLVGVGIDITARKEAENHIKKLNAELEQRVIERTAQLEAANAGLERANQHKSDFLAGMSHELRTPLNAILGFSGTLLMKLPGPLNTDQEKQLRTVQSSAKHLLSLINDLLDLAKIEAGKREVQIEPVVAQEVVEEIATLLRPLAEQKGLQFRTALPDAEISLRTDRRALLQILINLVSNAVKFTAHGAVGIEVQVREDSGRRVLDFSVTDTGSGISAEDHTRLFDVFSQVPSSSHVEGSGLGLHLSQNLAGLLGGAITFASEPGAGSCFTLTLPFLPA